MVNNQFWESISLTLMDSLWQGAVITLIAFLGIVLFRKAPARLRHNLILICILAMPAWSLYSFIQHNDHSAYEFVYNSQEVVSSEIVDPSLIVEDQQVSTSTLRQFELLGFPLKTQWFGLLWMLGLLLMLARGLGAYLFLNRLRLTSSSIDDRSINNLLNGLKDSFGLTRPIALRESIKVSSPMVYGYLRPVVLFPLGLIQGLTTEEVEVILLHELAHLKRNDFLINIVINALRAVYFYHPAFWWLQGQLDNEREFATDEMVLSRQCNSLLLIRALTKAQEFKMTTSLGFAGSSKYQLLKRVNKIMKKQQSPNWLGTMLVIAILSVSSLLLSQSDEKPSKNPSKKETFDSIKAPFHNIYLPVTDSMSIEQFQRLAPAFYSPIQKQDTLNPKIQKFGFKLPDEKSFDSLKVLQGTHAFSLVAIEQDTNKVYKAVLEIIKKDSPIKVEVDDDGEVIEIKRNGKALKGEEFKAYKNAYDQLQQYKLTVIKRKNEEQWEREVALLNKQLKQQEEYLKEVEQRRYRDWQNQIKDLNQQELSRKLLEDRVHEAEEYFKLVQEMAVESKKKKLSQNEIEKLMKDLQEQLKDLEKAFEQEKSKSKRSKNKKGNDDPADFEATVYSDDHSRYVFPDNAYKEEYLNWTYSSLINDLGSPLIVWNGKMKPSWDLENLKELPGNDIKSIEVFRGAEMEKYPKRKIKGRTAVVEVLTQ